MKSIAHEIMIWLESQGQGGIGRTEDWALYLAVEPVNPLNVITFYDTGGGEPDTDELNLFSPTFQVRVRAVDYPAGYAKQAEVRDLLIHAAGFETSESGARFESIDATSDILFIGRDENNRHLLTANYRVIREEL